MSRIKCVICVGRRHGHTSHLEGGGDPYRGPLGLHHEHVGQTPKLTVVLSALPVLYPVSCHLRTQFLLLAIELMGEPYYVWCSPLCSRERQVLRDLGVGGFRRSKVPMLRFVCRGANWARLASGMGNNIGDTRISSDGMGTTEGDTVCGVEHGPRLMETRGSWIIL